jgi:hypothetical protein
MDVRIKSLDQPEVTHPLFNKLVAEVTAPLKPNPIKLQVVNYISELTLDLGK